MEFLRKELPKSFLDGEYARHRENVLLDREKGLLPQTMGDFVRRKKRATTLQQFTSEISARKKKIEEMKNLLQIAKDELVGVKQRFMLFKNGGIEEEEEEETNASLKCPDNDCRGFLNGKMVCGLCDTKICKDCHMILTDGDHECREDDKATVALIKKECKACPGCSASTFKTEGCDQMWCTSCHTTFSWRTGKKVVGRIHNPHYYEYMRASEGGLPREVGDIPCGGLPTYYQLANKLRDVERNPDYNSLFAMHRMLEHVHAVEIPRYIVPVDIVQENKQLRFDYIQKKIGDNILKDKLVRGERDRELKLVYHQIYEMFDAAGGDIFRNLLSSEEGTLTEYLQQLQSLFEYTRDAFDQAAKLYKKTCPFLYCKQINTYPSYHIAILSFAERKRRW